VSKLKKMHFVFMNFFHGDIKVWIV